MDFNNLPNENTTTFSTTAQDLNNSISNASLLKNICYNFDRTAYSVAMQFMLAIVIFILNSVVIFALLKGPKKTYRKPAFVFIASLSVTDIMLSIVLLMFCIITIGGFQYTASSWVYITATTSVCFNASVNFLLIIALDRLLFIAYNARYRKIMKKRNVKILIGLSWLIGSIPVLPIYFAGVGSCAKLCECVEGKFLICAHEKCSVIITGFTRSLLFGLVFYFLFMLTSICAVYGCLFWKVHQQSKRVDSLTRRSHKGKSSRMKREYRLARTLGIVVAVFFCCWVPLIILYAVEYALGNRFKLDKNIIQGILFPTIINSVLNPIIYAARIPRMRLYLCPCFKTKVSSMANETNKSSWSKKIKQFTKSKSTLGKPTECSQVVSSTAFPSGEEFSRNVTESRDISVDVETKKQKSSRRNVSQIFIGAVMNVINWRYESPNNAVNKTDEQQYNFDNQPNKDLVIEVHQQNVEQEVIEI